MSTVDGRVFCFESALRVGRGLDGPCDRIYFLTDGEPSDGDPTSVALDVSRQLRAPVHTIVRAVVLTSPAPVGCGGKGASVTSSAHVVAAPRRALM